MKKKIVCWKAEKKCKKKSKTKGILNILFERKKNWIHFVSDRRDVCLSPFQMHVCYGAGQPVWNRWKAENINKLCQMVIKWWKEKGDRKLDTYGIRCIYFRHYCHRTHRDQNIRWQLNDIGHCRTGMDSRNYFATAPGCTTAGKGLVLVPNCINVMAHQSHPRIGCENCRIRIRAGIRHSCIGNYQVDS